MKKFIKEWVIPMLAVFVVALLVQKFLFFHVLVPSGSMEPTIHPGDRMLVLREYNPKGLKTGDIIVFKSGHQDQLYVKRLIGKPGDKVSMVDGQVILNGTPLEEDYITYEDNFTGEFQVPQGHYFFLGDNRPNSDDSRFSVGFVPEEAIQAKAGLRFWPFNRIGFLK